MSAVSLLRRTARRAARQAWHQEPLPPAQSELLRLAASRPGITVADAAHELHLAANTVSTLVSKLTSVGLLRRGRSAEDGRGAQRLAEWRDLRADLAGQALTRLSTADQRALAAALPALVRLAEEMGSSDRAA